MRLNSPLITSFIYKDKEYPIDLAFDNVLDVFEVLADESLRDYEKAEISLALLLGEGVGVSIELWNHVYESFIQFEDKEPIQYDRKGNAMPVVKEETEQLYDIEQDADFIYSSFQQAYGMNLFDVQGKMQWCEFRALLNGLPSETILQRIVQIRAWKPSKHESAEHIQNMKKLQKIYALDKAEEVE